MSLVNQGKRNAPKFEDAGTVKSDKTPEELHTVDSVLDSIIQAPKEKPKKQISIYLDVDVAKEFDHFGKKHGKGSKSDLINNFLKKAFDI